MNNKRLIVILGVAGALLLAPYLAMQFTSEVDWSPFDFVAMGILLLATGLLCELVLRKIPKARNRLILCMAIVGLFLVIWAELAVGIFGSPLAGN